MRVYSYPIEFIKHTTVSDGQFGEELDSEVVVRSCLADITEKQANRLNDNEAMLFQNYYSVTVWNDGTEIKPDYLIKYAGMILEIKGINDSDNKRKTTYSCLARKSQT